MLAGIRSGMHGRELPPQDELRDALRDIVLHPVRTLVPAWSWKAAGFSALLRAATFFVTNLRAGRSDALRAGLVVWFAMPFAFLLAQYGVHRLAGTPYLGMGLALSFCLAAIASSFSWYAMRHGALLGGDAETRMMDDVRHLPQIILNYVLALPRLLLKKDK
jgi:hypothetical protein